VLPLQSLSNAAAALKGETVDASPVMPDVAYRALADGFRRRQIFGLGSATRRRGSWALVFASPKTADQRSMVTTAAGRAGPRPTEISRRDPVIG